MDWVLLIMLFYLAFYSFRLQSEFITASLVASKGRPRYANEYKTNEEETGL